LLHLDVEAGGLYANGSQGEPSAEAEATKDAGDADAGTLAPSSLDASAPAPVTDAGGALAVEEDARAAAPDAAASSDGGCVCGCSDPCLGELIAACEAPTVLLLAVCPKVPATCACSTTCTTPSPSPPSLDACVAQFLLTGT